MASSDSKLPPHLVIESQSTDPYLEAAAAAPPTSWLDGFFAACKRIEAPKSGDIKIHSNYKLRFEQVFGVPRDKESSALPLEKVIASHMLIKPLDIPACDTDTTSEGTEFAFGTLTLLVALSRDKSDTHKHAYRSLTCGDLDLDRNSFQGGEILADYQPGVKVTDDEVDPNRQTRHENNADQQRPGKQPWCLASPEPRAMLGDK